ncbi:MAG: LuxR C-terminal-related transcriptional regulator [Dehalococcoidia bacterium]|nr:LuxR C-terminal-related transcriptional regulator [Dehalococcoidia bacterium]
MTGLIERELPLALLQDALAQVGRGQGKVALVTGEAGAGKTSLLRALVDTRPAGRVLLGACDDLTTPRTLGPVRDFALQAPDLRDALMGGNLDRDHVMAQVQAELGRGPHPTLAIIEDIHWADDATADVLTFLIRRIEFLPVFLVLTVRESDLDETSRVRRFLNALIAARSSIRVALGPLTEGAVVTLGEQAGLDGALLYRETEGNPFYVSEVLAARTEGVPAAVQHAVLARVAALPEAARDLLELLSVTPGRTDTYVLDHCQPGWTDAVEPAERREMVRLEGHALRFRHELARRAVEAALSPSRRQLRQRRILGAMRERGRDWANIMHHAVNIGDVEAIVQFGPPSARRAAQASAFRQAKAHFRSVLPHAERFDPAERAALHEEYSLVCFNTEDRAEAVASAEETLRLREALGDAEALGRALRWRGRVAWWDGRTADAWTYGDRAIETLEPLGRSPELARSYAFRAQLGVITQRLDVVAEWAPRAIDLATDLGADGVRGLAMIALGLSGLVSARPGADEMVMEGIALAKAAGLHDEVARAYMNLAFTKNAFRDYAAAERLLEEGSAFASDHELLSYLADMTATRCMFCLDVGRWDEAVEAARPFVARDDLPVTAFPTLYVSARILARRGDAAAAALVERTWATAEPTGELQRIGPAASLAAELAFLQGGSLAASVPRLRQALALAEAGRIGRVAGEAAMWLQRAGALEAPPAVSEPAYTAMIEGRWTEAARMWHDLGCPYEEADALACTGQPQAMQEALRILEGLGAGPRAAMVRSDLQRRGVTVPRGPQRATRANPAGLTRRQVDVVRLLASGRTNAEIADELVLSTRTVDHHVAAILQKLDARNRREAARRAGELGLLEPAS